MKFAICVQTRIENKKCIYVEYNLSKKYRARTRVNALVSRDVGVSAMWKLNRIESSFRHPLRDASALSACPRAYHFPRVCAPIRHRKNSGPVVKPWSQMHLSIRRCSRSHWAPCQYKCKCHWEPCERIHWRSLEDDCSRRILQMLVWDVHRNWIALRIGTYRNVYGRHFVSRIDRSRPSGTRDPQWTLSRNVEECAPIDLMSNRTLCYATPCRVVRRFTVWEICRSRISVCRHVSLRPFDRRDGIDNSI